MFLFIGMGKYWASEVSIFKYISCSYLSDRRCGRSKKELIQIHLMFLFIIFKLCKSVFSRSFKYISCSYLSKDGATLLKTFTPFKYISCSYLSPTELKNPYVHAIQIHLMFLFIQNFPKLILERK